MKKNKMESLFRIRRNLNSSDVLEKFEKAENNIISIFNKKKRIIPVIKIASAITIFVLIFTIVVQVLKHTGQINSITKNKTENEMQNKTFSENDIIIEQISNPSIAVDYSDQKILYEKADDIIIGKVTKIIGGTNYNSGLRVYTAIFTLGEIEVLETFKGNLISNQLIQFTRLGGVISINEYEKGLDSTQIKKQGLNKLSLEEKDKKYISYSFEDDIQIKEGKIYLMYLKYDSDNNRYNIFGIQYGLREFNLNTSQVKNNDTGNWDELKI